MADLSEQSIDAALACGRQAQQCEPRARSARFDKDLGRIIVELTNGCSFIFPPHLAQGLETASEDELAQVEILGSGFGLHWEALDVDFSIPGLLSGIFGTKSYLARQAGQTGSPAKAAAARNQWRQRRPTTQRGRRVAAPCRDAWRGPVGSLRSIFSEAGDSGKPGAVQSCRKSALLRGYDIYRAGSYQPESTSGVALRNP